MPNPSIEVERSRYIERLHKAFRSRQLNVFVGAGTSQQSGFDGWDALNKTLMHEYLATEIGSTTPAAMLAAPSIETAARDLFQALGRDAVADFVANVSPKRFAELLATVLYKHREIQELPLKPVHHQIAALAGRARLYTLNFDPLLELAVARKFPRREWLEFRSPDPHGASLRTKYRVEHLHGWVDPDGNTSPEVVLTESDYLELTKKTNASANTFLKKMLASDTTTLIVGMSLSDPNFRRVLYFLNKEGHSSRERIYVATRENSPFIDYYADVHWSHKGLRLLFIKSHDDLPHLIRDIQWGEAEPGMLPKWLNRAVDWREGHLPTEAVFSDAWQSIAFKALETLTHQVVKLFGVPPEEKLAFGMFLPFRESKAEAKLRMVASSRKLVTGDRALYRAQRRVLSITKGQEQGIAGVSFATGTDRAVAYGEGNVDINFTPEMSGGWIGDEGYRDWRSIIALPMIDSEDWLPVAVITLTSNMPVPFWKQFGVNQNLLEPELQTILRRTARYCLVDFSA